MRATRTQPDDRGNGDERAEQRAHDAVDVRVVVQEHLDDATEASGLLEICVVARALEDDEPGVGDEALHEPSVVDGRLRVLLTPDEQHRDVHLRQQRAKVLVDEAHERAAHRSRSRAIVGRAALVGAAPGTAAQRGRQCRRSFDGTKRLVRPHARRRGAACVAAGSPRFRQAPSS